MIYLYLYFAVAAIVGLRLGWHLLFKLDRYDWYDRKLEIWTFFVFDIFLWPLLLIKPRNLLDPSNLFKDSYGMVERMRELDNLIENPPPCSALIRYRQGHGRYEATCGEFVFLATDVEELVRVRLSEHPHLMNDHEGAIFNWLQLRDSEMFDPSDVPSAWNRFQYVANDLIRSGKFEGHCLECGASVSVDHIVASDDQWKAGWNFDRLTCEKGHVLLSVESVHLSVRK